MKARQNKEGGRMFVDPNVLLSPQEISAGAQRYDDWHWGIKPSRVIDMEEEDYPRTLIECGRLIRLHIRLPVNATGNRDRHPRRQRDSMIELSKSISRNSHLGFDPEHQNERLYMILDKKARPTLRKRLWDENNLNPMQLGQVAALSGGRHGKANDYADIMVKPVGVITAVVYLTAKKGDEPSPSYYIHKMGELSHHFPILCCDEEGRLWLAGGNYTTPNPGITD